MENTDLLKTDPSCKFGPNLAKKGMGGDVCPVHCYILADLDVKCFVYGSEHLCGQ